MSGDNGIRRPHQAAAIENRKAKRKKRRRWRLPLVLALLAVLVWLLPNILASSPLPGSISLPEVATMPPLRITQCWLLTALLPRT